MANARKKKSWAEEVFYPFKVAAAIHLSFPHNTIACYLPQFVEHYLTKVQEQNTFEREVNKS